MLPPPSPRPAVELIRLAGRSYFPLAFAARFPFAMMVVGVLTLVSSARGSIALAGLNSAAVGLGTACAGPLLGAAADRLGQRPVLLLSGLANAAALLTMTLVVTSSLPDWAVLATAFAIGATAPQVAPMSRSRLIAIIQTGFGPGQRGRISNGVMAYESAADETVFVFGPVLVGLLASFFSLAAPVIGAAVLTVVFVTLFALHRTGRVEPETAREETPVEPASRLLRFPVLVLVAGSLGVGTFFGSTLTSLTAFMTAAGFEGGAGLAYGVMGIGSTILALAVAAFPETFALRARWLLFSVVLLGGALAYGSASGMVAVCVALGLAGFGVGPTLVTLYTLASERSPRGRSATTMSLLGSGIIAGQSAASAVTGWVAESAGVDAAMWLPVCAAAIVVMAGVLNLARGRLTTAEQTGATGLAVPAEVQELRDRATR